MIELFILQTHLLFIVAVGNGSEITAQDSFVQYINPFGLPFSFTIH